MPRLKGITKIQLFNEKTGELEQEVKEENMITNAIEECLNLPDYIAAGLDLNENRAMSLVYARNPVLDNFFNGILLFEQPMEEEKTRVIAPFDNMEIGHAGDTTSATLSHQGTYNTVESGAITNGYRRVWDFATDRANGKINCVCMTSRAGGTLGEYCQQSYQLGGNNFTSSTSDNSNTENFIRFKYDGIANPLQDIIKFFYMEQLTNGNIKLLGVKPWCAIVEVILASPFTQKLFSFSHEVLSVKEVFTNGSVSYQWYDWHTEEPNLTSDPGATYCYEQALKKGVKDTRTIYWSNCPYVYQNKIHMVYPTPAKGLRHIILNLDTYEIEQDKLIEVEEQGYYSYVYKQNNSYSDNPPAYSYQQDQGDGTTKTVMVYPRTAWFNANSSNNWAYMGGFFFDNHYFYKGESTSGKMIVTDLNGNKEQEVPIGYFSNVYIDEINSCVLIGEGSDTYRHGIYLLKKAADGSYQNYLHKFSAPSDSWVSDYRSKYSHWMCAPMKVKEKTLPFYCYGGWSYYSDVEQNFFTLYYGFYYPFLSTINNLSSPVTKTNGQTMKITYDIIQEDD